MKLGTRGLLNGFFCLALLTGISRCNRKVSSDYMLAYQLVVMSRSGDRLTTLFDGISPRPENNLALMRSNRPRHCGQTDSLVDRLLYRLAGLTSVVHAYGPCGGSYWQLSAEICGWGSPDNCEGVILETFYDPVGTDYDRCAGFYYTGNYCGGYMYCSPQETATCNSCA